METSEPLKRITVGGARRAAEHHGLSDGVVVIAFHRGQCKAVSYGVTKAKCRDLGRMIDHICDELASGEISLPSIQPED